eukprot:gnl/TRDRNA2_/TRDRNA2_131106_c0_seq3.p1 gnl/TRDRNA2_/TRDRNA2_131106_c0~~gnl/TRDRNA2_/TRDRNA2_131106_c0_seq3.p1  ORF type:complete len:181 (+),score=16.29 gnl/TRDRNA2_/TRDRNA2_131106_c0_seq3:452-994(+)
MESWRWIFHGKPIDKQPDGLPSNTWVEISHCGTERETNRGLWTYHARGSGSFLNLGQTAVFNIHADAVDFFLGKRWCKDGEVCDEHYDEMMSIAKSKGYQSLQFINQPDMRCAEFSFDEPAATAVEIVFLGSSGSLQLSKAKDDLGLRCGLNHDRACNCQDRVNEAGHVCSECHPVDDGL